MAQVNELITKFSFAGNISPLFNFNKQTASAIKVTGLFSAALIAGSAAFVRWSGSVLQSLDPLAQLEKRTGVAIGKIQELGFIASQSGSDVATMQGSILSLSQTIGDAAIRGSEDFSRLGISVRDMNGNVKTADVILGEIRSRFQDLNLSMMEQESIASSLGIDSTLVQMLNRTDKEMESLTARARELGTLNSDQANQIIAYNDALNEQRYAMSSIKQLIAVGFAPELTKVTKNFTNLIASNKDWITNVASKTIEVVSELFGAFKNTGVAVYDFIDSITGGHAAVSLFIAAAAAFAVTNPIFATISALILVIDDLVTAFQGGESVLASFFEDNFGIDIVEKIVAVTDKLKEFKSAAGFLLGTDDYEPVTLSPQATQQFDFIPTGYGTGEFNTIDRNTNTVIQTNTIEIKTNDPEAAGRAVVDSLNAQQEDAQTQFKTGVR